MNANAPQLLHSPRVRSVAVGTGLFIALLLFTQFVLPGDNAPGRGTPAAILFNGLVAAMANAVIAAGLVVVYRTIRIINFAQTGLGVFGASFCFELVRWTPVPFPLAILAGIVLGAAVGVIFDLVFGRRFFDAPRIVLTVLTITATTVAAITIGTLASSLPIFPNQEDRAVADIAMTRSLKPFLPFSGLEYTIGSLKLSFGFAELFVIEFSIIVLLALGAFFKYTKVGVAVRALSENADRAALLGISVGTISTIIWGISGALSAAGGIMLGALTIPAAAIGIGASALTLFLPLTAAVIGRMRSIPVAVLACIWLTVFATSFQYSYQDLAGLVSAVYLVAIVVALVVQRRRGGRSEESGGVTWEAVKEIRPVPKELSGVATVRNARILGIVGGVALLMVWPFVATEFLIELGSVVAVQSIIFMSLVVLTGWAGQISLAQWAFAAIGGVVSGALSATVGVPFWFAVPIGAVVAGGFAALVGIPALRIKGLFLAIPTLALAFTVEAVLFEERFFGWLLPDAGVDRPSLFLLDFEDNRSMYFLCVAGAALATVLVVNLRRSRFGRLLIALRENEANVQSFGVSAFRMKLLSFAVSGALAGFAGGIFVHQQRGISAESFGGGASLRTFIFAVFGGISSPLGAVLGSLFQFVFEQLTSTNDVLRIVFGALNEGGGTMLLLFVAPGGLISLFVRVRDSVLRIIAQRRQIVVPSLFADYDPEALERRLIPLAEPTTTSGLAALGPDAHYQLRSELYGEQGILRAGNGMPTPDSIRAIGAAAESFADAGSISGEIAKVVDADGVPDGRAPEPYGELVAAKTTTDSADEVER